MLYLLDLESISAETKSLIASSTEVSPLFTRWDNFSRSELPRSTSSFSWLSENSAMEAKEGWLCLIIVSTQL